MTYLATDAPDRIPYDILYKDFVVTIIVTKNCVYESLRKWLSQQHMVPQGLAYPTSFNELVEMINSGNFEPDQYKSKSKRNNRNKNKNKNKDGKEKETVGAIVEPIGLIPNTPTTDGPNSTEDDNDSETDSEGDDSNEEDNEEANICHVYALVNSGFDGDNNMFDPEAEEESTMLTVMKHSMTMELLNMWLWSQRTKMMIIFMRTTTTQNSTTAVPCGPVAVPCLMRKQICIHILHW